ncbi:hypothetical protein HMPREF1579_00823 [Gardnerella vaginalis JCP8066]|nr:hypothetical protein HMPREF1583_00757 [Gardnerella vaginalis JCP8151B]EPI59470.1 hypothetical protein HMPREF1579_00823 [Gardnerella vaginalis JCP8066]
MVVVFVFSFVLSFMFSFTSVYVRFFPLTSLQNVVILSTY